MLLRRQVPGDATLIAHNGASAQYIRRAMGHADISSANTYVQYNDAQLSDEAEDIWGRSQH